MPEPKMHPVSSSNVAAVGFDSAMQEIYVKFLSGETYVYSGADEMTFHELRSAPSVGSYLNRVIKGRFAYRRL
jgi:hypothetical protein